MAKSQSHISLLSPIYKALPRPNQAGFIRLTKKTLVTYLITFLVFSGTGLFYLFNPFGTSQADAAWFNDNWSYRQVGTITVTSSASDITDLQTLITVDTSTLITAEKLQSSCQDLRFTSQSGETLPYYIDSGCNTASTKIWVLADLVPKNTTTYTMYMYYGNPSAVAGSGVSFPNYNLLQGLVGYWTGNESSWNGTSGEVKDSSVNGNNGTATGGLSTTTGKYGNSGDWDSTDDAVSLGSPSVVDNLPASGMTVSAWIYPDTLGQGGVGFVTAKNTGAGQNQGWFLLNYTGNTLQFVVDGSTDLVVQTSNSTISLGAWNHVVLSWDGVITTASSVDIYVNGVEVGYQVQTNGAGRVDDASSSLYIGNASTSNRTFDGKIDDYRLYNRALTSIEVSNLYTSPGSITTTATTTSNPSTSFATEQKGPSTTLYWKLNDNTVGTAEDSTTNALDGTHNNTPTIKSEELCVAGKCLYFDGSNNENVSLADNAKLDFAASDSFSVSAWVKRSGSSSAINYILSKADTTNGGYKLWMDASGDLCFGVDDDASWTPDDSACTSAVEFDDNQWHLVTGVKSATTSITLFVDGNQRAQDAAIAATGTLANTNAFYVGVDRDGTTNEWLGFIDEVKIYNQALSAAQITANYNSRSNPEGVSSALGENTQNMPAALSNGLVGYWKVDESSGNISDSSGNSNTLTNNNTVSFTTGKYGNGGSFASASSETFSVADGSQSGLEGMSELSISLWVNPTTFADNSHMVVKDNTNGQCSFLLNYGFNGQINFFACSSGFYGSGIQNSASANNLISTNNWSHIVVTSKGGVARLYKNGVEQVSGDFPRTDTSSSIFNSTSAFSLGGGTSNSVTSYMNGKLDDVRIYNRGLSPAEVTQLYNWAPGPLAYWRMDEGTGSSVADQSGNAYTATLVGSPAWAQGKYGKSTVYDSSAGKYAYATNALAVNDFTYSAWINMSSNAASRTIFGAESVAASGDSDEFILWSTPNATQTLSVVTNGSTRATSTGTIPLNTWTHVAVTRVGSAISLYINGALDGTGTDATALSFEAGCNLYIGGDPTNGCDESNTLASNFYGSIDEVKVYNYGQTTNQITENMNAGHPAPGSPVGTPLGYWKFDEGFGTTANNSGNLGSTINGTLTNMASPATSTSGWTASAKYNKGLNFDASNDYIDMGSPAIIDDLTTKSISTWINLTNTPSVNYRIIGKTDNLGGSGWGLYIDSSRRFGAFSDYNPTDASSFCNTGVSLNTWTHLTATFDPVTAKWQLYMNGQECIYNTQTAGTSAAFTDASSSLVIGGVVSASRYFSGTIDEVKLYSQTLTPAQVKLDMNRGQAQVMGATSSNSNFGSTNIDNTASRTANSAASEYCIPGDSTTCTAPVGRWNLEEGSGTTANDSSGNANTGTITAGAGAYTKGKIGKGYSFDSADTIIDAGSGSVLDNLPAAGMTTELWYYPRSLGESSVGFILSKNTGASQNQGWFLLNVATNSLQFVVDGSTDLVVQTSNNSITLNTWNHISLSWNGTFTSASSVHIYVNGVETGYQTQTNGATRVDDAASNFYIGNSSTQNRTVDGVIDDVRIFNYSRTAAQIAWDYNKGLPLAHYKMDECQGTTINNSISSSFVGTLTIGGSGTNTAAGTCNSSGAWFNGVSGKRNYSINLDGTDDYITLANGSSFPANNVSQSISAWFYYPTTPVTTATIVSLVNTGSTSITTMQVRSGNIGVFKWGGTTLAATPQPAQATWHHVVYTFDGTTHSLYLNGRLANTSTTAANTATPNAAYIGDYTSSGGERWPGKIDDVKIFNYSLTKQQALAIYNDGIVRYGPVTNAP